MYHYSHDTPAHERQLPKGKHAPLPALASNLWPLFEEYLLSRGLDPVTARENRWYPSEKARDTLPRVVIPATNSAGLSYWQARAMVEADKRYQSPPVQRGDSVAVVWPTGEISGHVPLVVAEGPMDALAAASTGYVGVAIMGASPPEAVLNFIASYLERRSIVVVADSDFPADSARVMSYLASKGRKCTLILPTPYKDLAAAPIVAREVMLRRAFDRLLNR